VAAGWRSSSSGATYLVTNAKRPLLRFVDGRFETLPLAAPTVGAAIHGLAGASPDADRLALLVRASHVAFPERPTELWSGTPLRMTSTTLGIAGEPAGVSFGADDREVSPPCCGWWGATSSAWRFPPRPGRNATSTVWPAPSRASCW
jgi:hypothetical protein